MSKNALPLLTALTLMTAACASPADEPTVADDDQQTTTKTVADQEKQTAEVDQQAKPQWFWPWHYWPRPAEPPPTGGGCEDWECGGNHNRRLVRV